MKEKKGVCPHFNTHNSGFTLLELMLTVSLVAAIMMIIYGILYSTIEEADAVENIMETSEVGTTLLNIIRQDLEGAFVPNPSKQYFLGQNLQWGNGYRDRLDFVTTSLVYGKAANPQTGLVDPDTPDVFNSVNECGYQLRDNDYETGFMVLYRRQSIWIDDKPLSGGTLTELYDRVKSLHIQYYDGQMWQEQWDNTQNKGLPEAARVELVVALSREVGGGKRELKDETFTTVIPLK